MKTETRLTIKEINRDLGKLAKVITVMESTIQCINYVIINEAKEQISYLLERKARLEKELYL